MSLCFRVTSISLLSIVLFSIGCNEDDVRQQTANNAASVSLDQLMKAMGEQQSKAESAAMTVKKDYERKALNGYSYYALKQSYQEVKKASDGWISGIGAAITVGTLDKYDASLKDLVEKNETFVAYAETHHQITLLPERLNQKNPSEPTGGGMPPAEKIAKVVVTVLPALVDVSTKLLENSRKASKEKREEIVKFLETKRWKHFDQIQ